MGCSLSYDILNSGFNVAWDYVFVANRVNPVRWFSKLENTSSCTAGRTPTGLDGHSSFEAAFHADKGMSSLRVIPHIFEKLYLRMCMTASRFGIGGAISEGVQVDLSMSFIVSSIPEALHDCIKS